MSSVSAYPAGVPCWVDTFQPDPEAAASFYGSLLGWRFDEPRPMPGGLDGPYLVAGVGQAPAGMPMAVWSTYVSVDDVDAATARATSAGGSLVLGPFDAEPDGRLAVLTDPAGVAFSVWQAGARAGAQLVDEPGAWAMSALHTPSPAGAQAFYGELFGWQAQEVPDAGFALWRLPGHVGGTSHGSLPPDVVAVMTPTDEAGLVPPHWAVNFRVEDVDTTAERALELGGALLLPPFDTPLHRNAVIADPQQGVIAISAPRTP